MRTIMILALLCCASLALSQDKTPEQIEQEKKFQEKAAQAGTDTSKHYGWTHSIVTGLNLTQISFKDWAAGGENALSYTIGLAGASMQEEEKTSWTNTYKFAFGQTRLGSQGLRKTDDEIYLEGLLIYKYGLYINPYVAATLRSQFAKGYAYDNAGNSIVVSKFFDPGYMTQSIGVAYRPMPEITTRIGVGMRESFASDFAVLYTDDRSTPEIEKTLVKGGGESVTEAAWNFAENMRFTSRLELFLPFSDTHMFTVRNDNAVSAKVNKYITTNLTLTLISDPRVSPYTQMKQVLSLGLTYTLL
jgi:hypothetical protein